MSILELERLRNRLTAAGLEQRASRLLALCEPSIQLEAEPAGSAALPPGATRLGGRPDLPVHAAWPAFRGLPQSFLAQIDLREVHRLPGGERLPAGGLLSFFYDSEQRVWGFSPADRGGWQVLYTPPGADLAPRDFPEHLPSAARFAARRLRPRPGVTFAPWESSDIDALGLSRDEAMAYAEALLDDDDDEPALDHHLLGHPDPIQGDMQIECQLASNGLGMGDPSGGENPRARTLRPGATAWRLLLQIDSDDQAGMMWGDAGRLYFWMQRDDLADRRFDRAWCVLQCS